MQFKVKNPDGSEEALPINVKPASDYKEVYAHGAQGGFLGNYHFRIDFYREIVPPLKYRELEGGQVDPDSVSIDREIVTSVYIPLPFVKELANWLKTNSDQYEAQFGEIKLFTGDVVTGDVTKEKK